MEIQQHDGVVVEAAGISAGLRQAQREGEVSQGERGAPGAVLLPSLPPLYIGAPGGRRPWGIRSPRGGGGQGGRGVASPPSQVGRAPPLGFPNLGAGGGPRGAHQPTRGWFPPTSAHGALRDRWPHPVDPRDPSGGPGTIPMTAETSYI